MLFSLRRMLHLPATVCQIIWAILVVRQFELRRRRSLILARGSSRGENPGFVTPRRIETL